MKARQIVVDCVLIAGALALGWFCYDRGRAYDFVVQNTPYSLNGQNLPGMEAVALRVDDGAPKTLYDGDVDQTVAVGSGTHRLRIDVLDLDDRPIAGESREFKFTLRDLGDKMMLNIPYAYAQGTAVQ